MIGDRIKKERLLKNITQSELSKLLEVSPSTIGMYEQNRRLPDIDKIIKLSDIFDVSTDYLLDVTNIRNAMEELTSILQVNKELLSFTIELNKNEDMQKLIKKVENLDSKSIKQIIGIIDAVNFNNN